jgi:hypothetical protein
LIGLIGVHSVVLAANLDSSITSGEIWVEAESFRSLGGWFVDQQSFDQMRRRLAML